MTLRLYDTATRQLRELVPRTPGQAGIYMCRAIVQSGPQVGHLRCGVSYDVLRRWLLRSGYRVRLVRGVLPPTYEPRVTGPFARHWVHDGLLDCGEVKMSKSLGNGSDLTRVAGLGIRPAELRYYLAWPHYRSRIDCSEESLRESAVAYRRLEGFVQRAVERVGPVAPAQVVCADFAQAMDDDLDTPRALAALHEVVREGNTAYAEGSDTVLRGALASTRAMLDVLGADPLAEPWSAGGGRDEQPRAVVDSLVALAPEQRETARSRKDYAAADAVRDQLKLAGIVLEDTAQGPRWTIDAR